MRYEILSLKSFSSIVSTNGHITFAVYLMLCITHVIFATLIVWNMFKYGVFSGLYFPAFGLNTERYFVSLRIQSECGKIRTRKTSVSGHFSHNDWLGFIFKVFHEFVMTFLMFSRRKRKAESLLVLYVSETVRIVQWSCSWIKMYFVKETMKFY